MSTKSADEKEWLSPLPLLEHLRGRGMARCLVLFERQIKEARESVREGAKSLARLYKKAPFDAETVEQSLVGELGERLLAIMTRTLVLELNVARLEGMLEGELATQRFEHYLLRLRNRDVAKRLFEEYPELVEQVTNRLNRWSEYSLEFLGHLCEDWDKLRHTFFADDPGLLQEARFGAGDTHRGGRSVIIATFSGGPRLVYKPRTLEVDGHFNELLLWLNARGAEPPFRPLKSLDGGRHGWTEFVKREACESRGEVARFYRRQGAYLALLYTIEATDFHCENLIAAGEHPMLIDLEALFHPRLETNETEETARRALRYSVLKVGLLPALFWVRDDRLGADMSGLGSAAGQSIPFDVPRWEQSDTDEMHLAKTKKTIEMPGADNRPLFNGSEVNALDYAYEIGWGFERMYRILLRHRDEALEMVTKCAGDEVRVIARNTQVYASLLYESYHPDVLRDKNDREALFGRLAGLDACRAAEISDLLRGDVPLFSTRPAARHLWTSDGTCIENYFTESGLDLATRRIQQLGERDLERQLWIVRASMATLASVAEGPPGRPPRPVKGRAASEQELLNEACRIGNRLEEWALGGEEISWFGLTPHDENNYKLTSLETDLYDGLPGLVLFLAYLGSLTGTKRYTTLARAALKALRRQLADGLGVRFVGGFAGWGGLIYCFAHLSALWGDEELHNQAERMAENAAGLIQEDNLLDVVSGVAGLGLAVRSLRRDGNSAIARATAQGCGLRLLSTAKKMERGVGWCSDRDSARPLTGFAHGNAGTGYALLEIAALTAEAQFAEAGRQAFEYERALFSEDRGNWPDLRENRSGGYLLAWCHGGPGIGLSRLFALRHMNDEHLRYEINAALSATSQAFGGNHSLCHGDFGNLDTLLCAADALGDQDWALKANFMAGGILDAIRETGWICGNTLGVESPGLMTGLAGIGYGLLRLAAADQVPSVLALEEPKRI